MVAVFNDKETSDQRVITFPTLHPMYRTSASPPSSKGSSPVPSGPKLKVPKRRNSTPLLKTQLSGAKSEPADPNLTLNWSQLVHLKSCQQSFIQQWADQEKKNKEVEKPVAEQLCEICDDRATGLHYGIITCEG